MSAILPDAEHRHGGRSVLFYAGIAVLLALFTLAELGPLFGLYNLPAAVLIVLSVAKFSLVVGFFMHLWDDAAVFARVFLVPLAGAVAMVLVLMALYHTFRPSPRQDPFALQERYYEVWNGPCQAWMRSSVSGRLYCASPPIDAERLALYSGTAGAQAGGPPAVDLSGKSDAEVLALLQGRGKEIYDQNCATCHQPQGQGMAGVYPPLAGADYLADPETHLRVLLNGLSGPITVNGQPYNGVMPAFATLNDYNLAAVLTYERTTWGNQHDPILPAQVAGAR